MTKPKHRQIDDETLMAFLDGELSNEERTQVEQAISDDSELADRADRLKQVNDLVAQAHQDALDEPVPQHLIDSVWQSPKDQQTPNVAQLPMWRHLSDYIPIAAAASVALVAGGLLGKLFSTATIDPHSLAQADAGVIVIQNPLYNALENTPSQHRVEVGNGDIFLPVMSFKATDGRYCREFQVNADRKVSVGVACRQHGYWDTEILLAAGNRPADNQGYQPASDYSQTALDAVLADLWNGVAFDHHEEKALIEQAWHLKAQQGISQKNRSSE